MEVVHPACCGLDLHKRTVTACALTPSQRVVRQFGTVTAELLALGDWLASLGVTHIAMESTGVYWKPIWNLLDDQFTLLLVNAQHIKAVPGRKTDVSDAEWIADLLRHGLLRGSFVPNRAERELRELTRYRTSLVRERTAEVNRLQKTLEGANIKLASVASEVLGKSGRAMVEGLIAGETDGAVLAELAKGQLRQKRAALAQALTGRLAAHQRFLLTQQLAHIDFLDAQIAQVSAEVAERLRPFEAEIARLDTIPGVGRWTAEVILAEIGTDLTRFPDAAHLASWAGMCPGNHQSAGKRLSGRTRPGSPWLRVALTEAGYAAGRSKATVLGRQYRRLVQRRGRKRAALAIGHRILVIAYALLTTGTDYIDEGPDVVEHRRRDHRERRLIQELERLGNKVTVERVAA
jgi:transposase